MGDRDYSNGKGDYRRLLDQTSDTWGKGGKVGKGNKGSKAGKSSHGDIHEYSLSRAVKLYDDKIKIKEDGSYSFQPCFSSFPAIYSLMLPSSLF